MSGAVAGAVMGPRPGLAICSFWQGKLEIALRIIAPLVGSLPALVAASVALATSEDIPPESDNGDSSLDELLENTLASTAFVIAITGLAILLEIFVIVLRFCNVGLVNIMIKAFLIVAAIVGVVLILGHTAGGVVSAIYAADWSDFTSIDNATRVRDALASSAAFCFLSVFLFGFVVFWDILFLAKDWNQEVVKYTLKEAVTG